MIHSLLRFCRRVQSQKGEAGSEEKAGVGAERPSGRLEALEARVLLSATAVADLFTTDAVAIVEGNVLENDVAGLTAPASLAYEASAEDGTDGRWSESSGAAGFDLELGSGAAFLDDAGSSLPGIGAAFRFTGGGATMGALQGVAGDPTDGAASFELWVKPGDLTGSEVLLETGSAANGVSLSTDGDGLRFEVSSGGGIVGEVVLADGGLRTGEFNQVVGTIAPGADGGEGEMTLHLNGERVGSASLSESVSDWADGDGTGLGVAAGTAAGAAAEADGFEGEIAGLRFYETALSDGDVRDHYSARAARVTATPLFTELGGTVSIDEDGTMSYDPRFIPGLEDLEPGESRTDTFMYAIDDGFGERTEATVSVEIAIEPPEAEVDLAGAVYEDVNNDGVRDDGEAGIEGVKVRLFDASDGVLLDEVQTGADGAYLFDADLGPGTYEVEAVQPDGYLDGSETAGALGGMVNNGNDSHIITGITVAEDAESGVAGGYDFGELRPSELGGRVWLDLNQDGERGWLDRGVEGVQLLLVGEDDRGDLVSVVTQTDAAGRYEFEGLRPGEYAVQEFQPFYLRDGAEVLGTVNGERSGTRFFWGDLMYGIELDRSGSVGAGYDFTERLGWGGLFGRLPWWDGFGSSFRGGGLFGGGPRFGGGGVFGGGGDVFDALAWVGGTDSEGGDGGASGAGEEANQSGDRQGRRDQGDGRDRGHRRRGWGW